MGCCVWMTCLLLLSAEAVGEAVIYKKSDCNEWILTLIAAINYVSAWLAFIIIYNEEMTAIVDPDEVLLNNEEPDVVSESNDSDGHVGGNDNDSANVGSANGANGVINNVDTNDESNNSAGIDDGHANSDSGEEPFKDPAAQL